MTTTRKRPQADDGAARLSCRLDPRIKRRAEQAASLLGQSITDFTEAALAQKADEVFEREARIETSARDFERFVRAIESPSPPTPQLVAAMAEYERMRAEEPDGDW